MPGMSKHVVATVAELPPGGRKLVTVKGRPIAVFNLGGEFFGLMNRCPHQGAALCAGDLTGLMTADTPGEYRMSRPGEIIRCPWHGWEFDVRTGQSWCEPSRIKAKQFPVEITAGDALVKGPYIAETIAVAVEEDYLVVEV
jgi:3-phenylpropionate/trans-cinnamate dioxygenase ferredoxin subunit